MRLERSELLKLAKSLGYRPEILEKVILLMNLLNKFFEDEFLKDKFVLKGGTALNLFLLDLPRLSVDIDLNYIGSADREQMLEDKTQIRRRVTTVCNKLDIRIDWDPSNEHSGGKFLLSSEGALNQRSNLELDLNFILRVPLFGVQNQSSINLSSYKSPSIPVLDIHQLFCKKELDFDQRKLRLAFIVYGAMNKVDWLTVSLKDIKFSHEDLKNNLLQVLSIEEVNSIKDLKQWGEKLQEDCKQALEFLFPFTDKEKEFIESINLDGEINAHLLTDNRALQEIISSHPALTWKALNVKKHKRSAYKITG